MSTSENGAAIQSICKDMNLLTSTFKKRCDFTIEQIFIDLGKPFRSMNGATLNTIRIYNNGQSLGYYPTVDIIDFIKFPFLSNMLRLDNLLLACRKFRSDAADDTLSKVFLKVIAYSSMKVFRKKSALLPRDITLHQCTRHFKFYPMCTAKTSHEFVSWLSALPYNSKAGHLGMFWVLDNIRDTLGVHFYTAWLEKFADDVNHILFEKNVCLNFPHTYESRNIIVVSTVVGKDDVVIEFIKTALRYLYPTVELVNEHLQVVVNCMNVITREKPEALKTFNLSDLLRLVSSQSKFRNNVQREDVMRKLTANMPVQTAQQSNNATSSEPTSTSQ